MRQFFIFFSFCIFALAQEFTLYAPNLHQKDGKMVADSGVVIFSKDYFARAKFVEYDEKNQILILRKNVFINTNDSYTNADESIIDTKNKTIVFKDFFLGQSEFEIWLKSNNASYENDLVTLKDSYVSSCEVDKPTWKIGFKEGVFDNKTKDLKLKHSIFYYQNVPIFYMPVFEINVENIRRSGFLVPDVGIKSKEGFYYRQPIFIAPSHFYDFEIEPIIRSVRGLGIYNQFRLAGPNDIFLHLMAGGFKDKKKYMEEKNLSYNKHYGMELIYSQNHIFFDNNFQEGFYFNGAYLNDIDYINLVSTNLKLDGNFVNSKLNYFVSDDNNFYGLFARYFIDTSKESNKDTLQELPSLYYHRFTNAFFDNIFQYNADLSIKNFYRKELSRATLYRLDTPFSINFNLFNDYLDLKFEERLLLNYASYKNYQVSDEHLFATTHNITLSSNLANKYNQFYHTINPSINFKIPGLLKGGFSENYLYNHNEVKSVEFALSHFFYNNQNHKKLSYFVNFEYFNKEKEFGVLSNKINYYFNGKNKISDEVAYNLKNHSLQKHFINLELNYDDILEANFGYFYSKISSLKNPINRYFTHKLSYIFKNRYKIFYNLEYNAQNKTFNQYSVGFEYRKKCINYSLRFKQTIEPVLSKENESIKQQGVYFTINLYPLGGTSYDFGL